MQMSMVASVGRFSLAGVHRHVSPGAGGGEAGVRYLRKQLRLC